MGLADVSTWRNRGTATGGGGGRVLQGNGSGVAAVKLCATGSKKKLSLSLPPEPFSLWTRIFYQKSLLLFYPFFSKNPGTPPFTWIFFFWPRPIIPRRHTPRRSETYSPPCAYLDLPVLWQPPQSQRHGRLHPPILLLRVVVHDAAAAPPEHRASLSSSSSRTRRQHHHRRRQCGHGSMRQ